MPRIELFLVPLLALSLTACNGGSSDNENAVSNVFTPIDDNVNSVSQTQETEPEGSSSDESIEYAEGTSDGSGPATEELTESLTGVEGEALAEVDNDGLVDLNSYENKTVIVPVPAEMATEDRLFLKVYDDPTSPIFLGEIAPISEGSELIYTLTASLTATQTKLTYELFGLSDRTQMIIGEISL